MAKAKKVKQPETILTDKSHAFLRNYLNTPSPVDLKRKVKKYGWNISNPMWIPFL